VWAALTARINQRLGRAAGFFAPLLYRHAAHNGPALFREVTSGGNERHKAHAGWNPCTGLGVPIGSAIEAMLRG
jgi:kumamolisin